MGLLRGLRTGEFSDSRSLFQSISGTGLTESLPGSGLLSLSGVGSVIKKTKQNKNTSKTCKSDKTQSSQHISSEMTIIITTGSKHFCVSEQEKHINKRCIPFSSTNDEREKQISVGECATSVKYYGQLILSMCINLHTESTYRYRMSYAAFCAQHTVPLFHFTSQNVFCTTK